MTKQRKRTRLLTAEKFNTLVDKAADRVLGAREAVPVDFPLDFLRAIDAQVRWIGVTRQAWIKMQLAAVLERDDLRPEYDFDYSQAKPNRFAGKMTRPVVAVVLEPDVAAVFKASEVNARLRMLITARKRKKAVPSARQHRRRAS